MVILNDCLSTRMNGEFKRKVQIFSPLILCTRFYRFWFSVKDNGLSVNNECNPWTLRLLRELQDPLVHWFTWIYIKPPKAETANLYFSQSPLMNSFENHRAHLNFQVLESLDWQEVSIQLCFDPQQGRINKIWVWI